MSETLPTYISGPLYCKCGWHSSMGAQDLRDSNCQARCFCGHQLSLWRNIWTVTLKCDKNRASSRNTCRQRTKCFLFYCRSCLLFLVFWSVKSIKNKTVDLLQSDDSLNSRIYFSSCIAKIGKFNSLTSTEERTLVFSLTDFLKNSFRRRQKRWPGQLFCLNGFISSPFMNSNSTLQNITYIMLPLCITVLDHNISRILISQHIFIFISTSTPELSKVGGQT